MFIMKIYVAEAHLAVSFTVFELLDPLQHTSG
jgi:hypothetical protein